ncbi:MAG: energy transducer TonB [Acidobacteria bacterium]|nr:energy transducer TonB [Acidobacteriota bacterium]
MRNKRIGVPPATITLQQVEQSRELPISIRNSTGSPLLITDARLRAMKVEKGGVFLLLPRVSFSSRTAKRITAVRLRFRHAPLRRTVHAEMYRLDLEPHGSFSTDRMPGTSAQRFLHHGIGGLSARNLQAPDPIGRVFHPYVIYFPVENTPADFTVGVLGVQFAAGETWGDVPARFPTPAPPRRLPPQALDFGSPAAFDAQPSAERVRVIEGEQRKKILYRLEPPCPSGAFSMGIDGSMVLEAAIGKDGTVQALRTIDGEPRLYGHVAASVVDAVKQWKYEPTLRQGEPVEVVTTITIEFVLDEPPETG